MRHLILLMSVFAIALTSCSEKIPPVKSSIDGYEFFFKEKKGKVYTGLRQVAVHNKRTAKYNVIKPKIIIPAEFDKIEDSKLYRYFECTKDGQKFLYYQSGNIQLYGKPFENIEFISSETDRNNGFTFAEGAFFKVYMKEKDNVGNQKIVAFIGGQEYYGISDFIPGVKGYFYIEKGELGYTRSYRDKNGKLFEKEIIPPGRYDRLFEVVNLGGYKSYYFLAYKNGRWMVLDSDGVETKKHPSSVNTGLLKIKPRKYSFHDGYPRRIGDYKGYGGFILSFPGYQWGE